MTITSSSPSASTRKTRATLAVLSLLTQVGGIEDPNGSCTAILIRQVTEKHGQILRDHSQRGFVYLLARMEHAGLIKRDVRAKRTYSIQAAELPGDWQVALEKYRAKCSDQDFSSLALE